jgi:hypothetical protein
MMSAAAAARLISAATLRRRDEDLDPAAVRAYEALWDRRPPEDTEDERARAEAMRARANARGWALPMAWDDDEIDDPAAVTPKGCRYRERSIIKHTDMIEDVAFLRDWDSYRLATPAQLADRLQIEPKRVERALCREAARQRATAA